MLTHISAGHPGNITLVPGTDQPGLFYIYRHQLYNYVNETFIYPVATVNASTSSPDEPLQLVAGEPSDAVSGGRWRWAGTRLMYDLGERTNRGQYYSCPDGSVYMNMQEYVDGSLGLMMMKTDLCKGQTTPGLLSLFPSLLSRYTLDGTELKEAAAHCFIYYLLVEV